jgi:ribosomal protein S5
MTRRLSSALVVNGTETGGVAVGYARSEKAPDAALRADSASVKNRMFIELYEDRTLFAPVAGKFNQTRVKILPGRSGDEV